MMLIGQLAAETGLSIRTIRFYETKKIVLPTARDPHGNRLYDDEAVHWTKFVAYLRQTGMSLADLAHYRQLVDQGISTLPARIELLKQQRAKVVQQIEAKRVQLQQIDHKLSHYQSDAERFL
ncbi:MerR family transcriptional regulator [Furfurilactobacillus curtus]|uniref:HTH merR-type domain-containing protein n=1 Tax=Furfurilactobacillus curtus TaxID=1746200 RepID=A0ABQ5JR68_9LACO